MTFTPTDEQAAIVDTIVDRKHLTVQALAGTGKTSTLLLAAQAKEAKLKMGVYVAFGKSNKQEAAKVFPGTVTCRTSHGLSYGTVGARFRHRLSTARSSDGGRRTGSQLADLFSTNGFEVSKERAITPVGVAIWAKRTITRFCYSADRELTVWHVPRLDDADKTAQAAFAEHVLPYAKAMWSDLQNPRSNRAEFTHDCYLKIWAMGSPRIAGDFIMLDEAQDANPLLLDVLTRQHCQLIAVGDSNQTLFAWRNAIDALQKWPAEVRLSLTESFRFGPQIASAANRWLQALDCDLRLVGRGKPGRVGTVERPDAILCRTNAGAVEQAMDGLSAGRAVGMAKSVMDDIRSMSYAALALQAGKTPEHPSLATFSSWFQVLDYVDSDPTAGDLAVFVRLVEKYGADTLLGVVDRAVDIEKSKKATLAIITGHKSKGMQWNRVRIGPDFRTPSLDEDGHLKPMPVDELQLCYVAATRAQTDLDDATLAWIDDYLQGRPTPKALKRWQQRQGTTAVEGM